MANEPYCFVLMPFGTVNHPAGGPPINFDRIYYDALVPAIEAARMRPYRDDYSALGGIVQKQLFEALLLCDFAIADLTIDNPNVSYELGVRHAARPSSTLTITARPDAIPFDVRYLRSVRYELDEANALTSELNDRLREDVLTELTEIRRQVTGKSHFIDSPLFQLVEGWRPTPPASLKTDLFSDRVEFNEALKRRLQRARLASKRLGGSRTAALADVRALQAELGALETAEAGVLIDLLLTFRAFEQWDDMISLAEAMPGFLADRATVQEQLAFALNRRAAVSGERDRDHALAILESLHAQDRSTAETFGLMGRVFKDRWMATPDPEDRRLHLLDALTAYEKGFRIDPMDTYPGINAAELMRVSGLPADDPQVVQILAIVEYATDRQLAIVEPTYWMHATLMEVAVLRGDEAEAVRNLEHALRIVRELWEPETTACTLQTLLDEGAVAPGDAAWVADLVRRLSKAADKQESAG